MSTLSNTLQWLSSDTPATRTQAKLGAIYRQLRRFLTPGQGYQPTAVRMFH